MADVTVSCRCRQQRRHAAASSQHQRLGLYTIFVSATFTRARSKPMVLEYDGLNNVTARYDEVQGLQETFSYDGLNRLVQSTVAGEEEGVPYADTVDYAYDPLGNMLSKSDVSATPYDYGETGKAIGGNAGPHAVRRIHKEGLWSEYAYDNNGSMVAGGGRNIVWTSFNKPSHIERDGNVVSFDYGPDRARYKKVAHKDFEVETTLYLGKSYERVENPNGTVTHKHFVFTEDGVAAIHIEHEDAAGNIDNAADETRYLHRDSLGSVDTITDGQGQIVERMGYAPFGARRAGNWQKLGGVYLAPHTNRGFTGHEHLDSVGLIHMNGRVYDPEIGRFLSADPNIQSPYNTQNYNRYSYVLNNPLAYTDPSGFFFKKLLKIVAVVAVAYFTGGAVLGALGYGGVSSMTTLLANWGAGFTLTGASVNVGTALVLSGAAGGFAAGVANSLLNGGGVKDALRAGLIGGLTGAATGFIGSSSVFGPVRGLTVERIIAHGVVGGINSEISGGKFIQGFASSAFTKSVSGRLRRLTESNPIAGTVAAALLGGTASQVTGGKFANGAITAATQYLFNELKGGGQKCGSFECAQTKPIFSLKVSLGLQWGKSITRVFQGKGVFRPLYWEADLLTGDVSGPSYDFAFQVDGPVIPALGPGVQGEWGEEVKPDFAMGPSRIGNDIVVGDGYYQFAGFDYSVNLTQAGHWLGDRVSEMHKAFGDLKDKLGYR